jgi:hypothetical protein
MSKTLKKVLIFLMLLVIVVLVIFIIQLLLPGNTNINPTPSASDTTLETPTETGTSPSPTDTGSFTSEKTADGTAYHITVPGAFVLYSVTVDDTAFTLTRDDGHELFKANADENEYLKISFSEGSKAADLAPGFLDKYINYTNFEQSGENYIPGTKITGETVTADDGNKQCEAWLVDTDKGVLGVVISYTLAKKDTETVQLYKILGTLIIDKQ